MAEAAQKRQKTKAVDIESSSTELPLTIAQKGFQQIRGDIIFGRLKPGQRLKLDQMTGTYGASVSTLREILSRLSSEGFVIAEGQKGFEVAPVSPAGFREVASLRRLLESFALEASFAAADLEWEGAVVSAHHKLAQMERRMLAGDRDDTELWKRYDREFHQALISACGSQALLETYGTIYDHYLRYQMVAVVFRGADAASEHQALLECALARDANKAIAIIAAHIQHCVDHTVGQGLLGEDRPLALPPLDPETVGDSAYRRIRSDILFGRLAPGQKLKLERMKADYGIGVSTLREILNRLASEQLVSAEGQKGFEVFPVSAANLKEIAALRQLLECYALELSFAIGDIEWEGRVVAAHHKLARMEAKMAAGDPTAVEPWKRYDWQFHQALISACGSRILIETHAAIFDKYLRYQVIALSYRGGIADKEHKALLDCALDRDATTATKVLKAHVAGGVTHALAQKKIR
ncbi:GntR family transcriptional regulator [Lacibacterium aquatile]|uniref:GntR family transcriptional regulator n=1 Tax=Lacibacterium aquatile TaxID=1168082 RepID=A0ABW5DMF2_9PROT